MGQLADGGDGFYAYVDTIDEAEKRFIHDLSSTLQVIGKDAKVQVDFNQDVVESYRLVGFENRDVADDDVSNDIRNDNVDAGEIGAGHNVTALYGIKPIPNAQGHIATAFIRWEKPRYARSKRIGRGILHRRFGFVIPRSVCPLPDERFGLRIRRNFEGELLGAK